MPQGAWTKKRERQYDHIKESLRERGHSADEARSKGIKGRSKMNKAELERAVGR